MPRKRYSVEEIIGKLREAEVALGQGATVEEVIRRLGISEPTYYRWRGEYGGLQLDQAKRLKDLEREHARLKKLVAEQVLDNDILREAARGNFCARRSAAGRSPTCKRRCQSRSDALVASSSSRARASVRRSGGQTMRKR